MITKLPDLAQSFKKMKLIDKLEKELIRSCNTGIGSYLLKAIQDKQSPDLILQTVKEMAQDNRERTTNLIGEELYYEIISL